MTRERKTRIIAWLLAAVFALTGLTAAGLAVYAAAHYHDALPILLSAPDSATRQLTGMLEEICDGRYGDAAKRMLGCPELGADKAPADPLGALLWDAFAGSMDYRLEGECYTTGAGLAQDVTVTYLDISSVTADLRRRAQEELTRRVAEAEDVSQIYDESNNYREDFVMDVLLCAAEAALQEDARSVSVTLTVNLKYENGQWWVVADKALLDAISGGILF